MEQKISMLLNKIEDKKLVLPEFQREFTWNKTQAKNLISSFLSNYPTGAMLFWMTKENIALKNMPDFNFESLMEVILDGQQRLTTLYLLIKDSIPPFYNKKDITSGKDVRNLYYDLRTGELEYYKKLKMKNKPSWVKVTDCFKDDKIESFNIAEKISQKNFIEDKFRFAKQLDENLNKLKAIRNKNYPIIYVEDSSTLREALTVFDRVNSAGTPLSDADIALAHMCSRWPETRRVFKKKIKELKEQNFEFDLKFFVRGMNAVINHRADYKQLHYNNKEELKNGFKKFSQILDYLLNILKDIAFIYSTNDLNTPNVLIPLIGYLSLYGLFKNEKIRNKSLYWMYAALYNRRFTSSVDQKLEADLNALKEDYTPDIHPLDDLLTILEEDAGNPIISKGNINSRGVMHPFYNMMNIVIRAKGGVDWNYGINLSLPFGKNFSVESHHIFPQALLKRNGYDTVNLHHNRLVHEIANRVPLTKKANIEIFDKPPKEYLPILADKYPGNLEKFFIPQDRELWKVENYESFLENRRKLIANGINKFMKDLILK
ncbi:MAG: DUF262 domain-containing protein [Candidatus Cloacimonetes bacterium]|nr:DUF262 domain-containing protein [Candidatus Cloacimonadota bacterium]